MQRSLLRMAVLLLLWWLLPAQLRAAGEGNTTLVLPLRTVGVSETTAVVARDLLAGELEARGLPVAGIRAPGAVLPSGADGCDEADCAARLAGSYQAARVVYGSLSRLGTKLVVRAHALRAGEDIPYFSDQLTAQGEEDLDVVMRRVAEGIAAGRPNAGRATVESITGDEAQVPRRRLAHSGLGVRTGFLFPGASSYAGEDRLTHFRIVYKFEAPKFLIESSALLASNTSDHATDWALLDLFGARIFGLGDVATYAGGGIGIHRVHLERERPVSSPRYPGEMEYRERTATTLSADVGGGFLLFRTYNFQLILDLRYHAVFDDFADVDGNGAHGVIVSFGINH